MSNLVSIKQLIDLWPSRKALAEDIDTSKDRVDKWAQSGSIPAKFHAAVLKAAAARSFIITAEDLVRLHDPEAVRAA